MKFILSAFLAFNAAGSVVSANLLADDSSTVGTYRKLKGSKSNPPTVPPTVPPEPPAPVCPDTIEASDFVGEYVYPVIGGKLFSATIQCPSETCSFTTSYLGAILDTSLDEVDRLDTDIPIGGSDVVRLDTDTTPENQCVGIGTFSAKNAVVGKSMPIFFNISESCGKDVESYQPVVKLEMLFGELYAVFSFDNGSTYENEKFPYSFFKLEETQGGALEANIVGSLIRGVGNALRVASTGLRAIGNVVDGVRNFFTDDDPNDPRNPDGSPVNYTNPMTPVEVPDGWVGGFENSNPLFPYPTVDLSSLPVTGNMENIDKLTRMQKVRWPEFSWQMVPGTASTRIFVTLSTHVSRLGYDNAGRVWSIICPQLGTKTDVANFNLEVTVTGVRGWTNEPGRITGVQMSVVVKLWFTPPTGNSVLSRAFRFLLGLLGSFTELPLTKQKAIVVDVNDPGNPNEPLFRLGQGLDPAYNAPWFKVHWNDGAYATTWLAAQVGPVIHPSSTPQMIQDFNELIVALFNFKSGNMVKNGNTLSWNIWFQPPQLVNQTEWQEHAEFWRDSLNFNGTTPGDEADPNFYYFNGDVATPQTNLNFIVDQLQLIYDFISKHFPEEAVVEQVESMQADGSLSASEGEEILDHYHRARVLAENGSQN